MTGRYQGQSKFSRGEESVDIRLIAVGVQDIYVQGYKLFPDHSDGLPIPPTATTNPKHSQTTTLGLANQLLVSLTFVLEDTDNTSAIFPFQRFRQRDNYVLGAIVTAAADELEYVHEFRISVVRFVSGRRSLGHGSVGRLIRFMTRAE
jgi:hypothetical protein